MPPKKNMPVHSARAPVAKKAPKRKVSAHSKTPVLDLTGTTCIWGKSESGKSYLGQKMVEAANPAQLVVISPQDAHGTDAPGVEAALEAGAPRIICNNNSPSHQIGAILYALNYSTKETPVYVVADEAPGYLKSLRPGLSKAALQGRHAGFGMLIIGQRPAAVHAELRSQAKVTYWMRLTDHRDLSTAKEILGPRVSELKSLKQGQFIEWR